MSEGVQELIVVDGRLTTYLTDFNGTVLRSTSYPMLPYRARVKSEVVGTVPAGVWFLG